MNIALDFTLRGLHHIYVQHYGKYLLPLDKELDPKKASDAIYSLLSNEKPCMIARFGSTEILCATNYIGIYKCKHSVWNYITDKSPQFWWNSVGLDNMKKNAGFFPLENNLLEKFGELLIKDAQEIDLLGSWRSEERLFVNPEKIKAIQLLLLEPFHTEHPWTRVLEGKKILVIHPFTETIQQQYKNKRALLFKNPEILPDFSLETIKAVQSIGGISNFKTWFDALQYMKDQIDSKDYDICLIGCGAYGLHLAAHVKRMGKKAIHLGGVLQLLFGIRGRRWENPDYGIHSLPFITNNYYNNLINEYWVRPSEAEKPNNAKRVEGACYW